MEIRWPVWPPRITSAVRSFGGEMR
jgi:hypothetical protein